MEVQTLEDLVDLALHEINGSVGQIHPSHPNSKNEKTYEDLSVDWVENQNNHNCPESFEPESSELESSNLEEEEMVNENVENNNDNLQPWLLRDALAIL